MADRRRPTRAEQLLMEACHLIARQRRTVYESNKQANGRVEKPSAQVEIARLDRLLSEAQHCLREAGVIP